MAHFAQLDDNNVVINVIVVANKDTSDENGNEVESIGIAFCQSLVPGRWVKTSYNHNFRKRYAMIGGTYDEALDAFIRPKPYPSWVLNTETADWQAPVPRPAGKTPYTWDEVNQSWVEVVPENN